MKKDSPVNDTAIPVITKVDGPEEFSYEPAAEEVVLFDECGDTQWDKVLLQHDLADQVSGETKNKNPLQRN